MDHTDVLDARLATRRLSGPPAGGPTQVVRELLCVQSQDAPLAQAMIALRCSGATDRDVQAALAAGELIRTHVLRPTWHYVAAADLRWLVGLTSPQGRVGHGRPASAAEPHRAHCHFSSRRAGDPAPGQEFREPGTARGCAGRPRAALAVPGLCYCPGTRCSVSRSVTCCCSAELRALICSAPVDGPEHRYALLEEVVAPPSLRDRDQAITELVSRFVAGHGPVALTDLTHWARVRSVKPVPQWPASAARSSGSPSAARNCGSARSTACRHSGRGTRGCCPPSTRPSSATASCRGRVLPSIRSATTSTASRRPAAAL